MNLNKLSDGKEVEGKTTGMLKSTSEIAKLISNEYLKEIELKEYCQVVESDFVKYQKNFQDLMISKNQSAGIKAEYKSRNKINNTNSESLLKALNELYKYKCELKLNYVTIEKELKLKKLKYKKIIADYESAWDETLKKYNKSSIIAELLKIQDENQILENEIEVQVKLIASTKIQFTELKENIVQNFFKTVVKFSKLMIQYNNLLTSKKRNEKNQSMKAQSKALDFKLFKTKAPFLKEKSSFGNESTDDASILSSIDVTIFDDLMVPLENLESQHLDEDSFLQNDGQRDTSKDQMEGSESINNQDSLQLKNKKKDLKENTVQDGAKALVVEENESHYFQQQYLKQFQTEYHTRAEPRVEENFSLGSKDKFMIEGSRDVLKSANNTIAFEDEAGRDIQMECEESLSEGSYEKHYSINRDLYDHQKTSSISSEDIPLAEGIPNENDGCVRKLPEDQQKKNSKPRNETETNDFKSFTGFFTMGSDNDNPTPSIFKLF